MLPRLQHVTGAPRRILRLEGLATGLGALVIYGYGERSWWLLVALILVPDISIAGYLFGPRAGAIAYNLAHTYLAPVALIVLSCFFNSATLQAIAIIWVAHIGFDRALGYGLKYITGFKDTHLSSLKRPGQQN